jgi:hypothetical protein
MNADVFGSMASSLAGDKSFVQRSKPIREKSVPDGESHISFAEYTAVHGSAFEWLTIEAKKQFESGRKYVLMEVVFVCATLQAVIPDWAVDALLVISERLSDGRTKDLNEAFGEPSISRTMRAKRKDHLDKAGDVIRILGQLRVGQGQNLSRDSLAEAAQQIRENGIEVSDDDVRKIYEKYGSSLKHLKIGTGGEFTSMFVHLPKIRRSGRPIFEDKTLRKVEV